MQTVAVASGQPKVQELAGARPRQDTAGVRHRVVRVPCAMCGCPNDYSLEELGLIYIWEAGPVVEPACLDVLCECHLGDRAGSGSGTSLCGLEIHPHVG